MPVPGTLPRPIVVVLFGVVGARGRGHVAPVLPSCRGERCARVRAARIGNVARQGELLPRSVEGFPCPGRRDTDGPRHAGRAVCPVPNDPAPPDVSPDPGVQCPGGIEPLVPWHPPGLSPGRMGGWRLLLLAQSWRSSTAKTPRTPRLKGGDRESRMDFGAHHWKRSREPASHDLCRFLGGLGALAVHRFFRIAARSGDALVDASDPALEL